MMAAPTVGTVVWSVAVLWLMDGTQPGGHTLISRETFKTWQECVMAIPRYESKVEADFGARGVVVCIEQ